METSRETLYQLIESRLRQAGLKREYAATVAEVLAYADARGIRSYGAARVEYYVERVSEGGTNHRPEFRLEEAGPRLVILRVDNTAEQVAVKMGVEHTIKTAQQNGITVVSIGRMGRNGAIPYFVQQTARVGLIGISMCQSDPVAVPFGSAEIYYGTNPLVFAAPGEGSEVPTLDMVTTVQAWEKMLDACSRNVSIPDTWTIDKNGASATDPFAVHALLPAAGPKGYGLTMMTDVLSGALLDLPFG